MDKAFSGEARRELVRAIGGRYRNGSRSEKARILDEFVAVTGYHRKYGIRVLNGLSSETTSRRIRRPSVYDEAVREALVMLWEASDRVCGKRLKPLLGVLVPALERHGHLCLNEVVRTRLLSVSAATIDRVLKRTRASQEGGRRRRAVPAVRRSVPVRTFADWNDPEPGYMETDLVAHSGQNAAGSFVHSLVLTDIASGWTECVALVVREGTLVVEAIERLRMTMPFRLRGVDVDNGSEFINETVVAYCADHDIELTRSRPYRKNDQAWVEQKNGAVVRRLVGYGRLAGLAAAETLTRLYAASRFFVNFFQPSFKLAEKTRIGSRVSKRYHAPQTPCARLLASGAVSDMGKERLQAMAATLDPLRLLDEIRTVQHQLAALAAGRTAHLVPHREAADLEQFLRGLATAWKGGEVRPTHRRPQKPLRNWRTRKDPFEGVWLIMRAWLDDEPDQTAKELLQRLQAEHPGAFPNGQLRTLQRRVQAWRSAAARQLVFADPGLVHAAEAPGSPPS
jgi:hypothetical protein